MSESYRVPKWMTYSRVWRGPKFLESQKKWNDPFWKEEPDWLPLSTAPKDGARIILTDGELFAGANWDEISGRFEHDQPISFRSDCDKSGDSFEPDHWAPMPVFKTEG